MASDAQDTLYKIFAALAGNGAAAGTGGGLAVSALEMATGGGTNSQAAQKDGGSGAAAIAMDVVKGGFGLVPLVTTLLGLFGGGEPESPPPLTKYALPAAREFQAAETATGFASVDYDQAGMPRAYGRPAAAAPAVYGGPSADGGPAGAAPVNAGGATQIHVNVQAMDARSFLDRSNEIAAAVRDAMLNLNSINDVVNDL